MKLILDVNQDCIDRGRELVRNEPEMEVCAVCPVAQAIAVAVPGATSIFASLTMLCFTDCDVAYEASTPLEIADWMEVFDKYERGYPVKFEVEFKESQFQELD